MSQPTAVELQNYYEDEYPEELRALLATLEAARVTRKIDEFLHIYGLLFDYIGSPDSPEDPKNPTRPAALARYHLERKLAGVLPEVEWNTTLPNGARISAEEAIAIGLLGLWRIFHTYENANPHGMATEQGLNLIKRADALADAVDVKNLPPWTIHGDGIAWLSELIQDKAKTLQKIGKFPEAAVELLKSIGLIRANQTGGQPLTPGEQSSLAVTYYRLGEVKRDVHERKIGLQLEHDNVPAQFNRDRLLTLAFGTFKSAINPQEQATLAVRTEAMAEAGKAWLTSFRRDPNETLQTSIKELRKFFK